MRRPEELFARVPIHDFLGLVLEGAADDAAELSLAPRLEFLQEGAVVQGGILSALADTTAAYCLIPTLPAGMTMTGIEFKMNFLRPATLAGGVLRASGTVVRRGRNVAVCQVRVAQAGHDVALGVFTFLYLPRASRPGSSKPQPGDVPAES